MVNKLYDLAAMQPEVPSSVREHYKALEKHAGDCIGCQSCEDRCPLPGAGGGADGESQRSVWNVKVR